MSRSTTKPYLVRAIYEWCCDNGFTPYLTIRAIDNELGELMRYARDGEITLNISINATPNISIGNETITFSARFNGVSQDLSIPIPAVRGIFARENGQGMFFPPSEDEPEPVLQGDLEQKPDKSKKRSGHSSGKPNLQVIK